MKVSVYSSVEEMKSDESLEVFSQTESLIQCLNVLDFYAALRKEGMKDAKDDIDWIDLKFSEG